MRAVAILLLGAAVAGCVGRLIPPGVSGDSNSVTVSNTYGLEEAWPEAVEHCAIYGKVPKHREWKPFMSMVFDCVPAAAAAPSGR